MAFCSRCGINIEGRYCTACGYDNQPQEKHQTVEDTVKSLYSLRAGMSLISVQIDETKKRKNTGETSLAKDQNKIDSVKKQLDKTISELEQKQAYIYENEHNNRKNKLEKLTEKKNELEMALKREKNSVTKKKTTGKLFELLGWLFGFIGVISAIVFVGALILTFISPYFSIGFNVPDPWGYIILGVAIGGIVIAAALINSGRPMQETKEDPKFQTELRACIDEINGTKNLQIACKNYEKQIPSLTEYIDEKSIEKATRINNLNLKKKELKNEIQYYNQCSNEMYNALEKEYSEILDTRDWKNLDLVIYYLETRRAISVREALQLVDRQRQTEAIIESMKIATEQISETIRMSTQKMQETVIGCTKIIATQLIEVGGRLNSIEVSQDIMNNHLRNISSQVTLNNAMIEKANVSSEAMMDDIKQMRIYIDNKAIKERNSL